jgi:hypothetical protein
MNPGGPVIMLVLARQCLARTSFLSPRAALISDQIPRTGLEVPAACPGWSAAHRGPGIFHAAVRQRVGTLITGITRVALHPEPLHFVPPRGRI